MALNAIAVVSGQKVQEIRNEDNKGIIERCFYCSTLNMDKPAVKKKKKKEKFSSH